MDVRDRFDRQLRIAGWDQTRLTGGCVAVYGRDWAGAFTVLALRSLGVGKIAWLGRPCPATETLARWMLDDSCPPDGCAVDEYPSEVEYGPELSWAIGERRVDAFVCCAEDVAAHHASQAFARELGAVYLAGTTARGGWYGFGAPPYLGPAKQEPVAAMALAALLADSVRAILCPLPSDVLAPEGVLGLQTPAPAAPARVGTVAVVGAGGIGVHAAIAAMAALDCELHIVDFDRVELTNLNRQGLYTVEHARTGANKAVAARDTLIRLFPGARVFSLPARIESASLSGLAKIGPGVLLSAVDNARTRLAIQDIGCSLGIPVVQGGSDVFAADCYTQDVGGALLDEQMHGALSAATAREPEEQHRRGCAGDPSYVVPGTMAGALMAYRLAQLSKRRCGLPPIHWRSGSLPTEHRSTADDVALGSPDR